jgi:transposase
MITFIPTQKVYVGQTCDFKMKNDIAYNYGPTGRWSDHKSSSKRTNTPLSHAIREYGEDAFKVDILEQDVLEKLDELEAKWIRVKNCIWPHGYNVAAHSRNKHHLSTTLQEHYKEITEKVVIRQIRRDGEYRLVYLILKLKDGSDDRLCFGQNSHDTFDSALNDAREFAKGIGCPVEEVVNKYEMKLRQLNGRQIVKVRITTASKLVGVYITTDDMISYKDQIRVCFGGKTISDKDAYQEALQFVDMMELDNECELEDLIASKFATGDCLKG